MSDPARVEHPAGHHHRRPGVLVLGPRAVLLATLAAGGLAWIGAAMLARAPSRQAGGPLPIGSEAAPEASAPREDGLADPPLAPPAPGAPRIDAGRPPPAAPPPSSVPVSAPAALPAGRPVDPDTEAGRRPPPPDTEGSFRKAALESARADPDAYVAGVKVRFAAKDATLAEKMGLAHAARDADPALAARVYAVALTPDAPDAAFRLALAQYLLRRRLGDPGTADCLFEVVVRDARAEPALRALAASAVLAAAPGEALARMVAEVDRLDEPELWYAALGGLAKNGRPEAREQLQTIVHTRSGDPKAQQIAAEGLKRTSPAAKERKEDDGD